MRQSQEKPGRLIGFRVWGLGVKGLRVLGLGFRGLGFHTLSAVDARSRFKGPPVVARLA